MIKTKFSDFKPNEIEYTLKLLKRNTPLPIIRKKTNLSHNEILAIIARNCLPYEKEQLPVYSINDDKIIITSDNHKGSVYENKRYEKLIYKYARENYIRTIINCGDEFQSDIEPLKYGIEEQTKAFLASYPSKNITTLFLAGNHERHAIVRNPELYSYIISRKDIKFLGLGSAYILWNGQLIFLHHTISKFDLEIPHAPTLLKISGHHHFLKVTSDKNLYAPSSSDDIKKTGAVPGFLVATMANKKLFVEMNSFGKDVVEKGVVLTKNIL